MNAVNTIEAGKLKHHITRLEQELKAMKKANRQLSQQVRFNVTLAELVTGVAIAKHLKTSRLLFELSKCFCVLTSQGECGTGTSQAWRIP